MKKPANYTKKIKIAAGPNKPISYGLPENPLEFYISDGTAAYGNKLPFTIHYDNPEHSVKLLKGDCIEILNQARENSVDMIFADPPYFLSNGGITCHAGKMVSVNKGAWDKSKGVEEYLQFREAWIAELQKGLKLKEKLLYDEYARTS